MNLRVAAIHSRQRRIMRAILSETDFDEILDSILDTTAALVEADEACILIKEPESERLHRYPASYPGQVSCKRIFKGVDLCRSILRTGDVVVVPDVLSDPRVDERFAATGIRSFVAVPANFNNQRVGVLYAFYRAPRDFERQGLVPLLDAPAQLAGQAITNLRHFARTQSQSNYMTSLIATSQTLTQARTDEEQFELAWKYASTQLKISTFFIGLYDPKADSIHYEMVYDRGKPGHLEPRPLGKQRREWGVSGLVVKLGEEMCWPTFEEGVRICQQHHIQPVQVGTPCQSCFYLPLKRGDQVLGVISIQSYVPYAFDDAIKDAFRSLGSLLVVGMEKNRLYKEEMNRRNEAEILRQAALQLGSNLDMENITSTTLEELRKVVPYDCASVLLFEGEQFKVVDCRGFRDPARLKGSSMPIQESDRYQRIYASGQPLNLANAPGDYPELDCPPYNEPAMQSCLSVPIMIGGEWLGLLDIHHHEAGFFTHDHEKLAQALAANIALAIRNAQSLQSTQQTSKYIQSVFEASTEILSAPDSMQALKRIVDTVCKAAHAMRAHVILMEGGLPPRLLVQSGFGQEIEAAITIRDDGISWQVFHSKIPYYKPRILEKDPEVHPEMFAQGVRAVACLPLVIGEKSIGVLWIHFAQPHEFTGLEKNILWLFANQSSVAFDRIHLLEEVTNARDEVDQVARKLTEDSYDASLKAIVAAVRKVMSCDSVTLYGYNQDRDEFEFPPTLLGVNDSTSVMALRRVSKHSILWRVLELDQYHKSEDAQNDPLLMGSFERMENTSPFVAREGIQASLGFPLKIGARKVGVMFINYYHKHSFTSHELINAGLFANQAAVVIQNAQLQKESTHRAALLRALSDADLVANNDLELDEILKQIAKKALELTGRFGRSASLCNLSLLEGPRLKSHAIYPEGMSGATQEIDLNSSKIGITGQAAKSGKT